MATTSDKGRVSSEIIVVRVLARNRNSTITTGFLKLDCSRVRRVFGWKPTWHIEKAVAKSVEWYQLYNMLITHLAEPKELADKMNACMREQIRSFLTDGEEQ